MKRNEATGTGPSTCHHTRLNGKLKRLHTMLNVILSTRESVHKLKKTKQRKIGKRNVQQARIKDRRFLIKRDLQ